MRNSYEFGNSSVMRELERQEIAKNGTGEKPIEKKAETVPDDILSQLIRLSKGLKRSGRVVEASRLDEKVALYMTASDGGEDLINFAHPDGDVEIAPAKEGLGEVETQVSQHKKIVEMIRGKGATAGLLNDLAGILKVGQGVSEIDYFNSELRLVKQQMAARRATPPVFKFNQLFGVGGTITGIIFDNIGAGVKDVIIRGKDVAPIDPGIFGKYAYEWKVAWPGLYDLIRSWGGGLSDSDLRASGTDEFYNAHVNVVNDSANKFTQILDASINSLPKQGLPANVNEKQIDSILNTLHQLNGPSGWNIFYIGHELQGEIKKKIENMILILTRVKTDLVNEKNEKIRSLSVDLFNLQKKHNPNIIFRKINTLEQARAAYDMPQASADDIIQSLMTWIGQWQKAGAFSGKMKVAQNAGGPTGTPQKTAPSVSPTTTPAATKPVAQKKRQLSYEDWRKENSKWKASVLPEYWQNVENMQRTLHNLITDAVPSIARISGKPIDQSLITRLGQTAREDFEGSADFDGKWGKATAGALNAAKQILSTISGKAKDINTGLPNGYLMYANSKEKQLEVTNIAKANIDLINNILYDANIKTTINNNVSSSTEYDKIPVNVPLFSEAWYTTKDDMGAPLTAADLTDLVAFERWFSTNFSNIINQAVSFENWKTLLGNFLNRAKLLLQSVSGADVQDADDGTLKSYVDAITKLIGRLVDGFRELGRTTGNQTAASAAGLESVIKQSPTAGKEPGKPGEVATSGQPNEGYDVQRAQREKLFYPPFGSVINVRKLANAYPRAFDKPIKSLKSGTNLGKSLFQILNPSISLQDISRGWSNPAQTPIFRYDVASWVDRIRFIGDNPNRIIRTPQGNIPLANLENTVPANTAIDKVFSVALLMVALPQLKLALNQIVNDWYETGAEYEWDGKEASVQAAQSNLAAWSRTIDSLTDYANQQLKQLYSGK